MRLSGFLLILGLVILLSANISWAQLAQPEIAAQESGFQRVQFIESGEILYNLKWKSVRTDKDCKITTWGDNNKQGAARIEWTEETLMESSPKGLRSVSWKKESTGAERMKWSLKYDWNANKAYYAWSDAMTGKKEDKTLSFGENAMPGDAMYWLLRGFPFEKGKGAQFKGEMIMTDGSVLNGLIIHHGEEKLQTAFGPLDTYKLELKPAGFIMGVVAPKMYIWYTKTSPHVMIRFDGREGELTQPRTKNVLLKYEPVTAVQP